jgi:myo-inositol-1(or 4)-monophosphatase
MTHDVRELRDHAEDLATIAAARVMNERARVAGADPWREGRAKSTPTDYVTRADELSEEAIRTRLATLRPDDTVLAEEGGGPPAQPGQVQWVVDPIDGTTNFRSGLPVYAVSVAAQIDGISVAGAVAEPATGRLWSAALGEGARLHDPRLGHGWMEIRASSTNMLSQVLLATGFSYAANERVAQAHVLARVIGRINDVRRAGSAALDLCWVAAGAVDGFVEHYLNPWDWAAGALIAEEAGAVVHLPGASASAARLGDPVFAAAPAIASDLVDLLAGAGAASLRAGNEELVRALPSVISPDIA